MRRGRGRWHTRYSVGQRVEVRFPYPTRWRAGTVESITVSSSAPVLLINLDGGGVIPVTRPIQIQPVLAARKKAE